jgi:hypothetical protein
MARNDTPTPELPFVDDGDELERLALAHSPTFQAILNAGRKEIRETGGVPHEEFWRQVEAETQPAAEDE